MIKSLELKNFKCFENQNISLNNLTLLTGLNGMGKSSVIQSLLLLRQTYLQNTLFSNPGGLVLNGDLVSIGTGQDLMYQNADTEEITIRIQTDEPSYAEWTWAYETDSDFLSLSSQEHKPALFISKDRMHDRWIAKESIFNDNFQYLNAERLGPRTFLKTAHYDVRNKKYLGIHGEHTIHFLSMFGDDFIPIDELIHPRSGVNNLKAQVEAWMEAISPGTRLSLNEYTDIDLVSLRYQFVDNQGVTNEFRPTNVGFGITNVLPILTAILSSKPGTLLLIENPEAHLHPQGQFEMGRLMAMAAGNGIQIVIETHSDHVLNGIRVATKHNLISADKVDVHFFYKDDDYQHKIISPILDNDGRFNDWPDRFFDEWDKSLDQLL